MKEYRSDSAEKTEEIAENFAKEILNSGREKAFLALFGGLGAGKTAFVRGFAEGMNSRSHVSSPTFAIMNQYEGEKTIYHFDFYNIHSEEDLYSTGFYDIMENNGVYISEWSENIEYAIPADSFIIRIELTGEDSRKITISEGLDKV